MPVLKKKCLLPVDNYAASIDLTRTRWQYCSFLKAGYYRAYMNNNPPEEMNEEAAKLCGYCNLKAGLQNLKALAEK